MRRFINTDKISTALKNDKLPVLVSFFAIILIWELSVGIWDIKPFIIPSPVVVAITLLETLPLMGYHIYVTISTALAGFGIAVILAFLLVFIMDRVVFIRRIVYPYLVISQTIPIIFIYPLFMIWFGFGVLPKIIVVTLVCFFPIVVNFMDGVDKIDPELIDLFRSMGAGRLKTFMMVKMPGAMPGFFSGLKIAATYSVMGAVIAEWLGAQYGMGIYMIRSYKTFATPRVFAAIIVVVILSMVIFQGVKMCERYFMPWYNDSK